MKAISPETNLNPSIGRDISDVPQLLKADCMGTLNSPRERLVIVRGDVQKVVLQLNAMLKTLIVAIADVLTIHRNELAART